MWTLFTVSSHYRDDDVVALGRVAGHDAPCAKRFVIGMRGHYQHSHRMRSSGLIGNASDGFSIRKLPRTSASMPVLKKVRRQSRGEETMASPLMLKEVLRTTGTPILRSSDSSRAW